MSNANRSDRTRLYLIVAKVIAVCVYIGGLAAVLATWLASGIIQMRLDDPRRQFVLDQTAWLMIFLVVPALLIALVLGFVLLSRRAGYFLRQRWLVAKLISLAVLIPSAHLFCRSRMLSLRSATDTSTSAALATQMVWGLAVSLLASLWVVMLGRAKPVLSGTPRETPKNQT